ncbi:MAG: response regulator [Planctomycetaceae bacterium]|nr:response regulator [Planctomycetaceae bacterium]
MTTSDAVSDLGRSSLGLRPTILCVDDDPEITRSIELILSNYDVQVVRDCCGRLGIWDVYQNTPDVIITDLRMPEGSGQHFLEQVKCNTRTAHIPVIVLTGQIDPQLPGRMRNLGAASFLRKPVHFQRLLAEIGRFIPLREVNWSREGAHVKEHIQP